MDKPNNESSLEFTKSREYLERLFSDSYKRELDQDEAVWRTLPFFATSLTAFVGLLSFAAAQMPPSRPGFWIDAGYLLIALATTCGIVSFGWLFYAIWPRGYHKIPMDHDIAGFASDTMDHHRSPHSTKEEQDNLALDDIRKAMIDDYSWCVTANRRNNAKRFESRARSAQFLCAAIALTIPLAIGIAWSQVVLATGTHKPSLSVAIHDAASIDAGVSVSTPPETQ